MFLIFSPRKLKTVLFHELPFCFRFKIMEPAAITIRDNKDSPSASKRAKNSRKNPFLSVACSTAKLRGTHHAHTFQYPRSRVKWLTLPLLIERLRAACQVVMQRPSRTMTSARQNISGLSTVTERSELHKSRSSIFSFRKPSHFSPGGHRSFCRP